MSKILSTHREPMLDDPLDPTHAGNCHHYTKLHFAVAAAYAVLCGAELERIKKALKKKDTRVLFTDWAEQNEKNLGFGYKMVQRYKAIAEHVRGKLPESARILLDRHPSSLQTDEQKTLLAAVNKIVDGHSIRELLEEIGIARGQRVDPGSLLVDKAKGGKATRSAPDTALIIQDELFGRIDKAGKIIEWWSRKYKLPGSKETVPLWQTMKLAERASFKKKLLTVRADADLMLAQMAESEARK